MEVFLMIVAALFALGIIIDEQDRETFATCFCVSVIAMVALAIFK